MARLALACRRGATSPHVRNFVARVMSRMPNRLAPALSRYRLEPREGASVSSKFKRRSLRPATCSPPQRAADLRRIHANWHEIGWSRLIGPETEIATSNIATDRIRVRADGMSALDELFGGLLVDASNGHGKCCGQHESCLFHFDSGRSWRRRRYRHRQSGGPRPGSHAGVHSQSRLHNRRRRVVRDSVASPLPPALRGSASLRSSRPSSLRIEPLRPPLAVTFVAYRLAIVHIPSSLGSANLGPAVRSVATTRLQTARAQNRPPPRRAVRRLQDQPGRDFVGMGDPARDGSGLHPRWFPAPPCAWP